MNKFFQPETFSRSSAAGLKPQYRQNVLTPVGTQNISNQLGRANGKAVNQNVRLPDPSNDIFSTIAPFLEKVSYAAGDYIHQPNDQIDHIYFPETAVISEFEILKDGRAVGLSLHGNESVLGLSSVFGSNSADNWTQVLLSGSVYKIKSETFKKILLRHQTLQLSVLEYLDTHTKQLAQKIVCNSYHTIEERLCTLLLTLQDCRKNRALLITQEQIAYFLGAHRPTVTQAALTLRAKKVISYIRKNLTIINRPGLEDLACDCYLR